MRKLLVSLLILCVAAPSQAWFLKKKATTGAAPPSYLVSESFDTNPGYDLASWTAIATPDPDYTTTALEGTQSFYCDASSATTGARRGITAIGEVWVYAMVRPAAVPVGTGDRSLLLVSATSTTRGRVTIDNTGKLSAYNGSAKATTVGALSENTAYHVWFHYKKGTGADGIADVGFSTDGTRPTSGNNYAVLATGGTAATDVDRVYVESEFVGDGVAVIFDKLRVDDVQIGDNPS